MTRGALIIYCNNTKSGSLPGTIQDFKNYNAFLKSSLGGDWYSHEIICLQNPNEDSVRKAIKLLSGLDYTFVVFSGHGFFGANNKQQYLELMDCNVNADILVTDAKKQTVIIDACRNLSYYNQSLGNVINENTLMIGNPSRSTRDLFDEHLKKCENGQMVIYAASIGEYSFDTYNGGAYSYTLLDMARNWGHNDKLYNIMPLNVIHKDVAVKVATYFKKQHPILVSNTQNRQNYFPFVVKYKI